MWDLPGPGLEAMCPVLAGGFLTTAPPGKSPTYRFKNILRKVKLVKIQMVVLNESQELYSKMIFSNITKKAALRAALSQMANKLNTGLIVMVSSDKALSLARKTVSDDLQITSSPCKTAGDRIKC